MSGWGNEKSLPAGRRWLPELTGHGTAESCGGGWQGGAVQSITDQSPALESRCWRVGRLASEVVQSSSFPILPTSPSPRSSHRLKSILESSSTRPQNDEHEPLAGLTHPHQRPQS